MLPGMLYSEQLPGGCNHTLLRALLLLVVEGLEESLSSRSFSNAPAADEAPVTGKEEAAELRGGCRAGAASRPTQETCREAQDLTCVPVACASKSASPHWEEPPGQGAKEHDAHSHSCKGVQGRVLPVTRKASQKQKNLRFSPE